MLLSIALRNIKQKKFRTFLASLSITIGTASLILFLGISNGIQNATFQEIEKSSPLTQITVRPNTDNTGVVSFLAQSQEGKLTDDSIEKLSQIDGIVNISPEIQFNNFASLEASLLGFSIVTDTMVFGVEKDFIEEELNNSEIWDNKEQPYPTVIPRKILDLYNLTIASPQGLPLLSEEGLIGKEIELYPNHSNFFPGMQKKENPIRLEIVGFSDKVNLIGTTLPYQIVQELNSKFSPLEGSQKYVEIFVETESPSSTSQIANQIEELGFNTAYFQKNIQDVEARFTYLSIALGSISLIILITASIAIINTFLATIAERTKEIGLFRAVGATKKHIRKIILLEAGAIGLLGSSVGIITGYLASILVNKVGIQQLQNTTLSIDNLVSINTSLILFTLIFGTFLSTLAAYLPAHKASNISPIKAINR